MSLLLPVDDNGNPISALGFDYRGTQKLAVSTSSAIRNAIPVPGDIEIVTIFATGDCRFEVGGDTITADSTRSPFLAAGFYIDVPLRRGERYISFIAEASDCSAYIINRL